MLLLPVSHGAIVVDTGIGWSSDWSSEALATLVVGIGAILVSWAAFLAECHKGRREATQLAAQLYQTFWETPELRKFREWVVVDTSYRKELVSALTSRREGTAELSALDYQQLEVIDRFCELLTRCALLERPGVFRWLLQKVTRPLGRSSYGSPMLEFLFSYWIGRIQDERPLLAAYINENWHDLLDVAFTADWSASTAVYLDEQRKKRARRSAGRDGSSAATAN